MTMQRGITIGGTGERAVFKEHIPSVEECLERLKRHGGGLVSGANCLSKDTFAGKDKANKKKFKELEEKQARLYYDSVDVNKELKTKATLDDELFGNEERNGVIGGIGAIYMCSFLLQKVMNDNFGILLSEASKGSAAVYTYCIEHVNLVAEFLLAFTDRITKNANDAGLEEFGIKLDVDKLCTDIDVLAIDNVIKAFSMRFCKTVKEQEAVIQARIDEANARREKELLKEAKSKAKRNGKSKAN